MAIKIFMTDVDDCLFAWNDAFMQWASVHYPEYDAVIDAMAQWNIWEKFSNVNKEQAEAMLKHFNTSARQAFMPPKLDAVEYVNSFFFEKAPTFISLSKPKVCLTDNFISGFCKSCSELIFFLKFFLVDCKLM